MLIVHPTRSAVNNEILISALAVAFSPTRVSKTLVSAKSGGEKKKATRPRRKRGNREATVWTMAAGQDLRWWLFVLFYLFFRLCDSCSFYYMYKKNTRCFILKIDWICCKVCPGISCLIHFVMILPSVINNLLFIVCKGEKLELLFKKHFQHVGSLFFLSFSKNLAIIYFSKTSLEPGLFFNTSCSVLNIYIYNLVLLFTIFFYFSDVKPRWKFDKVAVPSGYDSD